DNDGNGFTDCNDFSCSMSDDQAILDLCASTAENTLETCSDGIDNDGNGFIDCNDFSCTSMGLDEAAEIAAYCANLPSETSLAECTDGMDNDGNGFIDCDDFSCSRSMVREIADYCAELQENTFEKCKDGIDN